MPYKILVSQMNDHQKKQYMQNRKKIKKVMKVWINRKPYRVGYVPFRWPGGNYVLFTFNHDKRPNEWYMTIWKDNHYVCWFPLKLTGA